MSHIRRALVFTAALLSILAGAARASSAPAQATLSGETLSGAMDVSIACSLDSHGGSATFTASGTASGPYPGTFTESGSFTIENDQVTAFDATFTITSGSTVITASKTLTAAVPTFCTAISGDPGSGFVNFLASSTYEAIITTPTGRFSDTGTVPTEVALDYNVSNPGGLIQGPFVSSGTEAVPVLPSTKEQCKDGGWQGFGFRNQGQCIAAVTGSSK